MTNEMLKMIANEDIEELCISPVLSFSSAATFLLHDKGRKQRDSSGGSSPAWLRRRRRNTYKKGLFHVGSSSICASQKVCVLSGGEVV